MSAATELDLLHPLSLFRRKYDVPLPAFVTVAADEVPAPYQKLLVHEGDMTSRLAAFHGGEIVLTVLHSAEQGGAYEREVILRVEETNLPVEYGAIEIQLEAFAEPLRTKILAANLPLGGLLNSHQVSYYSRPKAFIKITGDAIMEETFAVGPGHTFYGRCNELYTDQDRLLARIVEVLRP